MIFAFLFVFLPTLFVYLIMRRAEIIKSQLLKLSLSWFLGQYISTGVIFFLAIFLKLFASFVLLKASLVFLVILLFCYIFIKRDLVQLMREGKRNFQSQRFWRSFCLLLFAFVFSFIFFKPHLSQLENNIYTSPVYWDFNIHFPIIQNFVYGDNFPPQNESFAGVPMSYHYFFDLLTAIYSGLGLGLVGGINFVSIVSFAFMITSIIGLGEEFFGAAIAGILTALLTLTSSSLRCFDYFSKTTDQNLVQVIRGIVNNNQHPFFFSFVEGNPYGYNGTMFNLFYFLAERQLTFAVLFLILYFVIVFYQKRFSKKMCFMWGVLFGLFFQWHLFATITVAGSLAFLLLFSKNKKKLAIIAVGTSMPFLLNFFYFKSLMRPEWFYSDIANYPKINFNFPTMPPNYPFSLKNAAVYYFYAYGIKIFLATIGLYLIFRVKKQAFLLFASIIIPTFVLINTIQLSPLSVYDNHKWLRPMNVFIDIIVAGLLFKLFLKKGAVFKLIGLILLISLTTSGLIELTPFLNSETSVLYAQYPSESILNIRAYSSPNSSFLSAESKEIHLAGRKVYLGNSTDEPGATSVLDANRFNKLLRENYARDIYASQNLPLFCQLILDGKIDYVEFSPEAKRLPIYQELWRFARFDIKNDNGETISFINVGKGCQ